MGSLVSSIKNVLPEGYSIYPDSVHKKGESLLAKVRDGDGNKLLYVSGPLEVDLSDGLELKEGQVFPLSKENAEMLRQFFSLS